LSPKVLFHFNSVAAVAIDGDEIEQVANLYITVVVAVVRARTKHVEQVIQVIVVNSAVGVDIACDTTVSMGNGKASVGEVIGNAVLGEVRGIDVIETEARVSIVVVETTF
jgi:hypothetical protein